MLNWLNWFIPNKKQRYGDVEAAGVGQVTLL